MDWTAVVAAATSCGIAGTAAAALACRRVATLPVEADTSEEARLLAVLHRTPDLAVRYQRLADTTADTFTLPEHAQLWTSLTDPTTPVPPAVAEYATSELFDDEVVSARDAITAAEADGCDALDQWAAHAVVRACQDERAAAGSRVRWRVVDGPADDVDRFARPLVRDPEPVTVGTLAVGAAAGAALGGFVAAATTLPLWTVIVVFAPWVAGAVALALLDHWTMYVDMPLLGWWAATLTVCTCSVVVAGGADLSVAGAAAPAVIVAFYMALGRLFARRAGRVDAHGAGDSFVLPVLLGVPWAVTASTADVAAVVFVACVTIAVASAIKIAQAAAATRRKGLPLAGARVAALPSWTVAVVVALPAAAALPTLTGGAM